MSKFVCLRKNLDYENLSYAVLCKYNWPFLKFMLVALAVFFPLYSKQHGATINNMKNDHAPDTFCLTF